MKKLLVILFLIFPLISMAQNFKGDGGKYEVYCDILNSEPSYNNGIYTITISEKEYVLVDTEGKKLKPKKDAEILTQLSKRGWILVSSYYNTYDKLHFIMKKVVVDDKEIMEGLELKK